jgi:hypothetical protein
MKKFFLKKRVLFVILILLIAFCFFFKIKQFSICGELRNCNIGMDFSSYEPFLDSLDLFIIVGGEGNHMDYFFYNGFRTYCFYDTDSLNAGGVWDGKYQGNGLVYLRPHIADDILLYRVRKLFDLFYFVEMNEDLIDVTSDFFANQGCKKMFVH